MNPLNRKRGPYMIETGVCRLCAELKKCRIINLEYEFMGKKEVYSDMLMECFGIMLSNIEGERSDRLVCATCVVRLRAGCSFKQQVLKCESQLLNRLHGKSTSNKVTIKEEESVHLEVDYLDDLIMDDDDEDKSVAHDPDSVFKLMKAENSIENSKMLLDIKPIFDDNETPAVRLRSSKAPLVRKPAAKTTKMVKKTAIGRATSEERQIKLKKLLLMKMEKLKSEQEKKTVNLAALPTGKRIKSNKDIMKFQNTVQIVECSYVCPFNNITGTYYCYYCRSVFRDPGDLREHNSTHDPKIFERFWPKKKAVKIDTTRIDCRLCDAKINDIETLKTHLTAEHQKRLHPIDNEFLKFKLTQSNVPCLECGQSFLFIDKLMEHMAEHFGTFICDKCGAAFLQASSLESHIRCHNKTNTKFPCHICGKNLSTNRSRYVHVSVVHEKKPVIDCFLCDDRFFSYDQRNKHMLDAHKRNLSMSCDLCGKVFDTRKKFYNHNQMVHTKVFKFNCAVCDKKFITSKQLSKHMAWHKKK